jgi:hypothetical protein
MPPSAGCVVQYSLEDAGLGACYWWHFRTYAMEYVYDEDVERQDQSTKVVMTKSPVKKNIKPHNFTTATTNAPQQSIYDDPNTRENALEKAGLEAKFPSRAKAAKFLLSEESSLNTNSDVNVDTLLFTSDKLHQLVAHTLVIGCYYE